MAVGKGAHEPVTAFEDWYDRYEVDPRTGALTVRGLAGCAGALWSKFEHFKSEHQIRVKNFDRYETMTDAEVVSKKPDLPNVSSGEMAGMVRRVARIVVQHTPNVKIVNEFDDDKAKGILAKYILDSKVIGDTLNSNEMQQNLFASVMSAFTLGFDAVCPIMVQRADGSWKMDYDVIHYQDVFPEPGVKDVRKAPEVFVRRYLTSGEVHQLIRNPQRGWDVAALKRLALDAPPARQRESVDKQTAKSGMVPAGYEVVTFYSTSGDPFLTFDARSKMLLRIEQNKDPLKRLPVQILVLEKDPQQPLGKSQVALAYGRQEFQDLMLNGAMKLWYKNINPTIIGYGTGLNGVPNMSPGKYTNIPNPNAKVEAFEVNTQTLLQYSSISQQNQGAMINLVGAADQQMAASAGNGMSATPQGVEAQTQLVDITTNNYQKAVENFFSKYCSYALTTYFQEIKGVGKLKPSADARRLLIGAGIPENRFDKEGFFDVDLKTMAVEYNVVCVPGSLVELEDEKQLRVLNELFVPLSQALPAIAQTGNPEMLANMAATMQFIVARQIELSDSAHAEALGKVFMGEGEQQKQIQGRVDQLEAGINEVVGSLFENNTTMTQSIAQMQEQMRTMMEINTVLMEKLGVSSAPTAAAGTNNGASSPAVLQN